LHKLNEKIKAIKADVFPPTKIKFDFIVINPPYTDRTAGNIIERSMWDKGNHVMHKLFASARKYLKTNGKIFTTWANFANFEFIENLARKYGYKLIKIAELKKEEIIYRVYEIKMWCRQ
jgi:tRNA1(Val) A37 N6-methylase TrmN6